MRAKKIAIVGGKGLMGQLFQPWLTARGHQVRILEPEGWPTAAAIVADCDLVIISVPIQNTVSVIQQIAPLLAANCILSDFTSLKVEPMLSMLAAHPGPVVGLHPMFGPTITSSDGQVIVSCSGRLPEAYAWWLDELTALGFTLKSMPAAEHDQAMSFVQGIEHFITFALGTFLQHKDQHPTQLLATASPIYSAKLLLLGRIFDQDPNLYADIILANPERIKLIQEFVNWCQSWAAQLTPAHKSELVAAFSQASKWMGEFTAYAQNMSDKLLNNK